MGKTGGGPLFVQRFWYHRLPVSPKLLLLLGMLYSKGATGRNIAWTGEVAETEDIRQKGGASIGDSDLLELSLQRSGMYAEWPNTYYIPTSTVSFFTALYLCFFRQAIQFGTNL